MVGKRRHGRMEIVGGEEVAVGRNPLRCMVCVRMGARKSAWFFFAVLFLCFYINTRLSIGAGTLSVGDSISGDQSIVSEGGGNFELGFFKPGNNSQNYYIGVRYRKISEKTIIWVANREKALSDKYSSQLKLSEDGNLVILDSSKTIIWSTNLTSSSSNSTEVALLDSGNLVLRNVSNSSDFMWESFDYPTHSMLPGARIWLNKLTNESHGLTSWKNSEDPTPGLYSEVIDPAGISQLILLWNGSVRYWMSGAWNGHIFSLVPEMGRAQDSRNVTFTFVSTQKRNYFFYEHDPSQTTRFEIDVTGQLNFLAWDDGVGWYVFWSKPIQICDVYALCGAFAICRLQTSISCGCLQGFNPRYATEYSNMSGWSGGCVRNTPLQCVNSASVSAEKVGFLNMSNVELPANPQSLAVGSAQACELACLNSCSCNAYAYDDGCSVWEGDLLNLDQLSYGDTSGRDLYLKLAASDLSNSSSRGNKKGSTTGVIAGIVSGVIAILCLLVVLMRTRRYWRHSARPSELLEGHLVPFSYRDLHIGTKNFSEKLGIGGFGSVFKGTLNDNTIVAVKKLEGLRQGEKQFRSEVSTIGMIQHVNLVRLRGFCCEGTKRLLVYDFMPNGSLDSHLFHEKKDYEILDWKTRYQIAVGIARGLAYLHEKCRDSIIHCDIKPENILLDADFCPKVADFGLAKLVGREFSRVLTSIRGTVGYLAPEWISGVAITTKVDVYSYGMVLFELISGRRNSQSDGKNVGFFPIWAASIISEDGEILGLLDDRLEGIADLVELHRACTVAAWCIQDYEHHRPSMSQVVQILEGMVEAIPPPLPKFLQALVESHEHISFSEPSAK